MTSINILKKSCKDLNSSSDEMVIDIEHLSQIPTQTNKWNIVHMNALNIEYKNATNIAELITLAQLNDDDNFKKLRLKDWNKKEFLNADIANYEKIKIAKIITIMKKIKTVVKNEDANTTGETKVDSFILTLLEFLGFDEDPFLLHLQYDYSVYVDKGQHKITSKVEFMVTKDDTCIVLIVENRHPKNVSETSDWSEQQIAGEIFGAICHNTVISNKKVTCPFNIFAIRVIDTNIIFYKSIITHEYMKETAKRLPKTHKLEIKRFPHQSSLLPNQGIELMALDFTRENGRILILFIMKGLYETNK